MAIIAVGGIAFATSTMLVRGSKTLEVPQPESKTLVMCFTLGQPVFMDVVHSYEEERSGWSGRIQDKSGTLSPIKFRGNGDWACLATDVTYAGSK